MLGVAAASDKLRAHRRDSHTTTLLKAAAEHVEHDRFEQALATVNEVLSPGYVRNGYA
eukprot:COSAG01_NODE_2990_length_6713_cov_105.016097_6_plen_58_part_00